MRSPVTLSGNQVEMPGGGDPTPSVIGASRRQPFSRSMSRGFRQITVRPAVLDAAFDKCARSEPRPVKKTKEKTARVVGLLPDSWLQQRVTARDRVAREQPLRSDRVLPKPPRAHRRLYPAHAALSGGRFTSESQNPEGTIER
jgi:hypothetical protein